MKDQYSADRHYVVGNLAAYDDSQDIDISTIRPLTTIERSYIQTFPDSFKFFGTKTNLEQMIGNAVPVNLAFFVASTILKYKRLPNPCSLFKPYDSAYRAKN